MTATVVPPEPHEEEPPGSSSRPALVATYAIGGLLGGLVGATTAVLETQVIKALLAVVTRQETWARSSFPSSGSGCRFSS